MILQDTLDHFSQFCDAIYVFDDCSTDSSRQIAERHPKVRKVLADTKWNPQPMQDGRQRGIIYREAVKSEAPSGEDWFCCFDADERIEFFTRKDLEEYSSSGSTVSGIQMRVFDFYITPQDVGNVYSGKLEKLREWAGPEYRRLLVFFRFDSSLGYKDEEMRMPIYLAGHRVREIGDRRVAGKTISAGIVEKGVLKHYGRALSVEQHREACEFFEKYFPEPTASYYSWWKAFPVTWVSRWGNHLMRWEDIVKGGQVVTYRYLAGGRHAFR